LKEETVLCWRHSEQVWCGHSFSFGWLWTRRLVW